MHVPVQDLRWDLTRERFGMQAQREMIPQRMLLSSQGNSSVFVEHHGNNAVHWPSALALKCPSFCDETLRVCSV